MPCCKLSSYRKYECVCVFSCFRVEKYRPQTLDDLISHKDILSTSKYVDCQNNNTIKLYNMTLMDKQTTFKP